MASADSFQQEAKEMKVSHEAIDKKSCLHDIQNL